MFEYIIIRKATLMKVMNFLEYGVCELICNYLFFN